MNVVAEGTTDPWRGSPVPLEKRLTAIDWRRVRFTACVGLYGGILGAAAILVNFISQVRFPNVPEHLPTLQSLVFSTGGFTAGAILTAPFAYWIHGPRYVIYPQRLRDPRGMLLWFVLGTFYGIVYSMIVGGIFLPTSLNILDFIGGYISVPKLLMLSAEMMARFLSLAVSLGGRILFTGLFAGVVFGGGAWVIDRFNASRDPTTARYGAWGIALALCAGIMIIVLFVPETTLAWFG